MTNILPSPEKTAEKPSNLRAKNNLLNIFIAKISPSIHDQTALLLDALIPLLLKTALDKLCTHYFNSKDPLPESVFHEFNPLDTRTQPITSLLSDAQVLNLTKKNSETPKKPSSPPRPPQNSPELKQILKDHIAEIARNLTTDTRQATQDLQILKTK